MSEAVEEPSLYERVRSKFDFEVTSTPTRAYHGPPGTGKTYQLERDVEREIENGVDPFDIGATSFRRSMAEDLAEALIETLGDETPWVNTTHAIGLKLTAFDLDADDLTVAGEKERGEFCRMNGIAYHVPESVADKLDPESPYATVRTAASDEQRLLFGNWLMDTLGTIKKLGIGYDEWEAATTIPPRDLVGKFPKAFVAASPSDVIETFRTIDRKWDAYKRGYGLIDFEDMLLYPLDRGLAPPIEVLLEDEFQDKTPLTISLHNLWAERAKRVYVAGDPYQAIYGYMGTKARFMNQALDRADETKVLTTSHRNSTEITEGGGEILRAGGYDPPHVVGTGEGGIYHVGSDHEYEVSVANNEDRSTFHLVRTNYLAREAASALIEAGIPFRGNRATARWTDKQADFYNAVVKFQGTIRDLTFGEPADLSALSIPEMDRFVAAVDGRHWNVTKGTFEGFAGTDLTLGDVIDVRAVAPVAERANPMEELEEGGIFIKSLFGDEINRRLKVTWDNRGPRLIENFDHRIMTIHASKGLEAEVVYLHTGTSVAAQEEDLMNDPEEARVWYVAATRTLNDLVIVESDGRSQELPI